MKPAWRILAVAALCIAALIALVVRENAARASGREIEMAMQPIDPRALLSGHYVIVSLVDTISGSAADLCAPFAEVFDETSWLALRYNGPEYRVPPPPGTPMPFAPFAQARTREEILTLSEGEATPIVRGSVFCSEAEGSLGPQAVVQTRLYGLDRFYINQNDAERIERIMREGEPELTRVFAIISIGGDGRGRLKGLIVDGERLELSWN